MNKKKRKRWSDKQLAEAWQEIERRNEVTRKAAQVAANHLAQQLFSPISVLGQSAKHGASAYLTDFILVVEVSAFGSESLRSYLGTMFKTCTYNVINPIARTTSLKTGFSIPASVAGRSHHFFCYIKEPTAFGAGC